MFGDVHGNLPALEQMLTAEKNNYDVLISHGDVVNYGPWSNECVDLLKEKNCICLKGNHEEFFLNGIYTGKNEVAQTFFKFCYPYFKRHKVISNFIEYYEIPGYEITHTLNNRYIYPDSNIDDLEIYSNHIFGHSHYQFEKKLNEFYLYNTGSVGQNRAFINIASYLIVDTAQKVIMKNIKYNIDIVISEMISRNYPSICINYYQKKNRLS